MPTVISAPGKTIPKYLEDFTITITPGNTSQTYVLGQSVDFNKCRVYWMGVTALNVTTSDVSATLEFNGTQNIIARRSSTAGTTTVNGVLEEIY